MHSKRSSIRTKNLDRHNFLHQVSRIIERDFSNEIFKHFTRHPLMEIQQFGEEVQIILKCTVLGTFAMNR